MRSIPTERLKPRGYRRGQKAVEGVFGGEGQHERTALGVDVPLEPDAQSVVALIEANGDIGVFQVNAVNLQHAPHP